jgi:hypothetical protein
VGEERASKKVWRNVDHDDMMPYVWEGKKGIEDSRKTRPQEGTKKGHTAVDLREAGELPKGVAVAERDKNDAVVRERADRIRDSDLLSSTRARRRHKRASVLAGERARRPEGTGRVPECLNHAMSKRDENDDKSEAHLPLAREVAVTGGDAHDESVKGGESLSVDDGVVGLGRRVHLGEDLLRERLGDSGHK